MMKLGAALAAGLAALVAVAAPSRSAAADFGVTFGGARPALVVASLKDRKFSRIVRQQYDFSCGSAAVATLLTHHYGRATSERDAFQAMWDVGDQARIRQYGFSLLEMKRYLESIGLKADGFRLTLDRVAEIGVPGIALVEVKGYRHFVVIKGMTRDTVLVGDPAKGLVKRSRKEFASHWDGTVLFVRSDVARGKAGFNQPEDWGLSPDAPFDRATDVESLQSVAINQTRPSSSGISILSAIGGQ